MGILDNVKVLMGSKPQAPTPQQPTQTIQTDTQIKKKILIVEDDEAIQQLYFEILSTEGYEVLEAENGKIGLDMIQQYHPNLILLDLMMPVMDGKTLLHQIRLLPEFKKLPVIILTNAGDVDSMRQTKVFDNANEFLIKSNVTPLDIVTKVKSLLM